ncbi:protein of unknown function [Taphrina deformans PYCC 5710]|uniref:Cell wall biogenesis protein Mhp1 n=1 Tax=Taphrina deformans (strain PYCC 5710 / ATCC 11124 / CBS 356.35 / IMI 108563 / JCM 9778 / NBRC 8474) TaxID=1097556 RepID=R4XFS6_TAPDE|nr:protein of unknown function [Taphrina deformans PYCC 5710]|eukprot:CCG84523.1 protein of unknown function [Taphrina deformans PYCC 5710]
MYFTPIGKVGSQSSTADPCDHDITDAKTVAQVRAARSRSNSWFSQVKLREARLQAAEDKALEKEEQKRERAEAKRETKDVKKSGFFGSTLRRLSSGSSKRDRRDSTASSVNTMASGSNASVQSVRRTLNKNPKRKRPDVPELKGTSLRRVCFQLDELVELRTYVQVEAEPSSKEHHSGEASTSFPTVRDMTIIDPYASSTPLDRADLYLQCCKVYKIPAIPEIERQLRGRGPVNATYEGPRALELRNLELNFTAAVALADCLGLPLTGMHLTEVTLDNCGLNDTTLQLLLSCLYTSAKLEVLNIYNNPELSSQGTRCALCFLCLSPQLRRFAWRGPQFDSECARVTSSILMDHKLRALNELSLAQACLEHEDLVTLLPISQRAGIGGYGLSNIGLTSDSLDLVCSMMKGQHAIRYLDLSYNVLNQNGAALANSLNQSCPLVSLDLQHCALTDPMIGDILRKLTVLSNFRRLNLSGNDLTRMLPVLRDVLPRMTILRRLGLSNTGLQSQDIVLLCETLAESKISELLLSGINLDSSALSAIYALSRVSRTLVNLEIDIPQDPHGEKLGRRILAECIQNIETQESSVEFTETDKHMSLVSHHKELTANRQSLDRHDDLHQGGQGIASALDHHLDSTEVVIAKDLPLDMYERARQIRNKIEPALAEPLSDVQFRRLTLVAETLDKVIQRFETTYSDDTKTAQKMAAADRTATQERYEHTGRPRAQNIGPRNQGDGGLKSRELEAEEGEVMKLAHKMSNRLQILQSASASASASPSRGPSRGEMADQEEARMLERMNQANGDVLKQKLYDLQSQGHDYSRALGQAVG